MSTRAQAHWIGPCRRPRRFERRLTVALFLAAALLLKPREYAQWAAIWGGVVSVGVCLYAACWVWLRKGNRL